MPSEHEPANAGKRLRALRSMRRLTGRTLPSRIAFFVLSATLATSLFVMWTSMHATYDFLRKRIDEKFPEILQGTAERLDVWYSQRRVDVETFARAATVSENIARLGPEAEASPATTARREMEQYLTYVLASFEQYEALFLLDSSGRLLQWVGKRVPLGAPRLAELAKTGTASVGPLERVGERRWQIASAPIRDAQGRSRGSLHALLRPETLEALLQDRDLGAAGEIYLVGADATYLTPVRGRAPGDAYLRSLPEAGTAAALTTYTNAADLHVVGTAMRYPGFDWTLVVEEPYSDAFAPVIDMVWRIAGINLGIVLAFGLIAFRLASAIVQPIEALCEAAQRVADGETEVELPDSSSVEETALLTRTFNRMTARLHRNRLELQQNRLEIEAANSRLRAQNEELQRANEALERRSVIDGLTDLHNHRFLQEQLRREISRSERNGDPLALLLIDIDHFKLVNERLGHAAGDAILRQLAGRLKRALRESDLLARYGGGEFAVLAVKTHAEGATALAEKLRLAVAEREFDVEAEAERPAARVRIRVSIGGAAFSGDRRALFADAEAALERAKDAGRDGVVIAGPPAPPASAES